MTVNNLAGTSAQSTTSSSVASGIAGGGGGASRSGNGSHATASSSRGGDARPKLGARQGQPQAQCGGGGIVIRIISNTWLHEPMIMGLYFTGTNCTVVLY